MVMGLCFKNGSCRSIAPPSSKSAGGGGPISRHPFLKSLNKIHRGLARLSPSEFRSPQAFLLEIPEKAAVRGLSERMITQLSLNLFLYDDQDPRSKFFPMPYIFLI
ncbi:MAG: hypothetical protein A2Z88_04510 [Omnitrophica WOR_2 bacterium GWA2_47_8]|nr:MAG: hypothetical protein A2Z88_04510 [Omnitrophica WOR_2 bacterium GWA2_47_8]